MGLCFEEEVSKDAGLFLFAAQHLVERLPGLDRSYLLRLRYDSIIVRELSREL